MEAASEAALVDNGAGRVRSTTVEEPASTLEPELESLLRLHELEDEEPAHQGTTTLRRDALYRRTLAVSDVVAFSAAILVGVAVAGAAVEPAALIGVPALVLIAKILGLYDRDQNRLHRETLDEVPTLFNLATLVAVIVFLAQDRLITGELGQSGMLAVWVVLFAGLLSGRAITRAALRGIASTERCLVIGDEQVASMLANKLAVQGLNARIVGALRDEEDGWTAQLVERTRYTIDRFAIHRVILTSECWRADETIHAIGDLKASGVKVSVLPPVSRLATLSFELDSLPGIALMGMGGFGLDRSSRAVKRAFDLLASTFVVLALSPLLLAVAIAIRLDSRGPVLFRQPRVGRGGKVFHLYKFRSMTNDADQRKHEFAHLNEGARGFFKITDDPRVTRVGRYIRRLSLDELPQIFNVIRGEMSLVGPRPLILEEDRQVEGAYRRRLDIAPGITGPWQVLGSWRVPLDEMVILDYLYVASWSLWRDVKLVVQTIPFVLKRGGI
jgi:exopolysaccharide biosynthesis polyprenyl glycosylphosphotransferase